MEGLLSVMKVVFSFLFVVQTITAVDPVEFLLSKDSPKNKSQVPLPINFAYSGDPKTDCCSLVLGVTVKDWSPRVDPDDYEDSGEEPPEEKVPQIEHGVVKFSLSHPQIRIGNNNFSMIYVKNEVGEVKERFIIKFDKCYSITRKIFGIHAITDIVDTKDIKIEIRDGNDIGVKCGSNQTNESGTNHGSIPAFESGIPWKPLAIISFIAFIITLIVLVMACLKLKKANANSSQIEKFPRYIGLQTMESGAIKTRNIPRGPCGETPDTTLNGGDENKALCGPITKDNLLPLIAAVLAVIFFVFAIFATVMYSIPNDTPTQVANDVVQSPTL